MRVGIGEEEEEEEEEEKEEEEEMDPVCPGQWRMRMLR